MERPAFRPLAGIPRSGASAPACWPGDRHVRRRGGAASIVPPSACRASGHEPCLRRHCSHVPTMDSAPPRWQKASQVSSSSVWMPVARLCRHPSTPLLPLARFPCAVYYPLRRHYRGAVPAQHTRRGAPLISSLPLPEPYRPDLRGSARLTRTLAKPSALPVCHRLERAPLSAATSAAALAITAGHRRTTGTILWRRALVSHYPMRSRCSTSLHDWTCWSGRWCVLLR